MRKSYFHILIVIFVMTLGSLVQADEFSSTNFIVKDPVIYPAGYSSSAGFGLWTTLSQIAIGTSTSAGFGLNAGFLYFPEVDPPVATATAGDGQVALSWTSAQGFLGLTPSGYNVGQATVSGGPYTYSSLGNVLSSTRTGLTNSTTYYFVIIVEDIFGNDVATSTEVSATPSASGSSDPGGGSSGGGGSGAASIIDRYIADSAGLSCSANGSDLNGDGKVDLVDLSILLFYLGKQAPSKYDCNSDGVIDFVDISILFYYWTDKNNI